MSIPVVEDDVVERLRARRGFWMNGAHWVMGASPDTDCQDAATLIEQQRKTIEELRGGASFLVDRLDSLEFSDLNDVYRDYAGHVEPSLSRLRALLQGDKKE